MTTCERTPKEDETSPPHMTQPHNYMQGIVGLTAGEVGRTAGSPPLLDVLFATHADVDPVFGLQCCGFDLGRGGGGALDVGGFDSRRFYGAIQRVPITKRPYWAVRATSIRFGAIDVLPADVAAPHDAAEQLHAGHRRPHGRRGRAHRGLAAAARGALRDARGSGPVVRPAVLRFVEINQCVGCNNSSLSHFAAMTRPSWLGRAARNRHRYAIEQASRRWRGGRRDDSARTRRKILISTQVLRLRPGPRRRRRARRRRL